MLPPSIRDSIIFYWLTPPPELVPHKSTLRWPLWHWTLAYTIIVNGPHLVAEQHHTEPSQSNTDILRPGVQVPHHTN